MSFTRVYRTDFDGSQPTLFQIPGGGSISEAGTGKLLIGCAGGANCLMWDTTNNAPLAYTGPQYQDETGLVLVEAKLTSYTWSYQNDHLAYLTLRDPSNQNRWAYAGYYPSNSNFYMQSNNNGSETSSNWGTYTAPSVNPHIYRIYFNPTPYPSYDPDVGSLSANQYMAHFSHDNGASWRTSTATHSLSWDLSQVWIGLGFRNWSSYPQVDLEWDYLEIYTQDKPVVSTSGPAGWEDDEVFPTSGGPSKHQAWPGFGPGVGQFIPGEKSRKDPSPDTSGWEDSETFPEAGGPTQHQFPELAGGGRGVGQRVPGAVDAQTVYSKANRTLDVAGYEDEFEFPEMQGPVDKTLVYKSGTIISSDRPLSETFSDDYKEGGFEDKLVHELDPIIDYMDGLVDGDGKELLGGYDVEFVKLIDVTKEPFGNPTPSNHYYGAAKDGKWYVDGEPSLLGDFGATELNKRSWTFSNIYPQAASSSDYDTPQWIASGRVGISTFSGPLSAGGTWKTCSRVRSAYRWCIVGDFDIEVDYLNFNKVASGTTHWEGYMSVYSRGGNSSCRVGVVIRTDNVRKWRADTNSWNSEYGTAGESGRLRLVRTGSTIEFFRHDGVSWVSMGSRSTDGNIETAPVIVQFHSAGYENADGTLEFEHFTVNSGTVSYDTGWVQEADGDDRGILSFMPSRILVVGTNTSLDLIDADTDLLWMRFNRGENNVLDQWNTNLRPMGAAWGANGILTVAFGDPDGTDGALLFISFASSDVSLRRNSASSITSATYWSTRYYALGTIQERNNGRDWSGDDDDLALPSNCCHDTDFFCADDPILVGTSRVYYAAATQIGVQVQTFIHWGVTDSPKKIAASTETDRMRFCQFDQATGDLWYMDSTKLYQAARTTIDLGINGGFGFTFTADYEKLLPGTQNLWHQYTMTRFGSFLYVPANEGIYKIDWPSGSFILEYGKSGSGAVREILPHYTMATEVFYVKDGSEDLLLVGIATEGEGQLITIRLVDHTIWAKTITFPGGRLVRGLVA